MNILANKKAIVTGSASGIGRCVAELYAQNGADLLMADINEVRVSTAAKEIAISTGRNVFSITVDVSNRTSIEEMARFANETLGSVDICCHCAGIFIMHSILEFPSEDLSKLLDVNVKGTFYVNQIVAKYMLKNGGKIINISSCAGKRPLYGESAYAATKSAVLAITRAAALELGQFGITVNAIAPGAVDTEMTRSTFLNNPKVEQEWINSTVLKRLCQPIDQAKVILFLSSELSDYITGECIIVSAGQVMGQ